MPKTALTAKFIRVPVEGGRLPVAPAFDDFLDPGKMAVLELGMQAGNLGPDYFDQRQAGALIAGVNSFNAECRRAGIPVIHIGYRFRRGGLDLRRAQYLRITPLSGKKPFPNPAMEEGTPLCDFVTEVQEGDLQLLSAKRHNAFEGSDLEFLLRVLERKIVIREGAGLDCLGMGTGFVGMCKDFKTLVLEDLFLPYFADLGEECLKACTMFVGLVVRGKELAAEIRAGSAEKEETVCR